MFSTLLKLSSIRTREKPKRAVSPACDGDAFNVLYPAGWLNVVVRDAGSIPWLTGDDLQITTARPVSDALHASQVIVDTHTGKTEEGCLTGL